MSIADFREVFKQIQNDSDAMPWVERQKWVQTAADTLIIGETGCNDALRLMQLLAKDPKWEVRKDVAAALWAMAPKDGEALETTLLCDSHAFVRREAEKARERRLNAEVWLQNANKGLGIVFNRLDSFEKRYGAPARKEAQRICEQYNGVVLKAMLHDLRSVCTHLGMNIAAFTDMDSDELPVRAQKKLSKLVNDMDILTRTLEDMRNYAKPLAVKRQLTQLLPVVESAVEMAKSSLDQGNVDHRPVSVRMSVPEGMRLEVSRNLLVLALANLIKNAYESYVDFSDGHLRAGEISIAVILDGSEARISIQDKGKGFSEAEMTAYESLLPGRVNKTKRNSTGYGLANARRYIQAHEGKIEIQTEEDVGTLVTITLPGAGLIQETP